VRSILVGNASAIGPHCAKLDIEPFGEKAANEAANGFQIRPAIKCHVQAGLNLPAPGNDIVSPAATTTTLMLFPPLFGDGQQATTLNILR